MLPEYIFQKRVFWKSVCGEARKRKKQWEAIRKLSQWGTQVPKQSNYYVALSYDVKGVIFEIRHRQYFQCSNRKPVFIREAHAKAKAIWAQRSKVDFEWVKRSTRFRFPFFEGPSFIVSQTVIKLYESLKKNNSPHPNYLLHHFKISKLEIKGTNHETLFWKVPNQHKICKTKDVKKGGCTWNFRDVIVEYLKNHHMLANDW